MPADEASGSRPPQVSRAQLEPVLARAFASSDDPAPLVFVRADPATAPTVASVGQRDVELFASASPLAIRARVARRNDHPLVVLTSCDTAELGDDLIARALRRKIYQVDRWVTVAEMFGARSVARSLSPHAALADALIEARPVNGYPSVRSPLLDLDTAIEALLRVSFQVEPESLADVLGWVEQPVAARAMRTHGQSVMALVEKYLTNRFGPGAALATTCLRLGLGGDVMRYALAGAVVHADGAALPEAAVRLDVALGDARLGPEVFRAAGAAAVERVFDHYREERPVAPWVNGADDLLAAWGASDAAWRSSVLPTGFEQLIGRAAEALMAWNAHPGDDEIAAAADGTIEQAHDHLWRREQPQRVERLRMAARLIRRRGLQLLPSGTLTEQLRSYRADGAWLDRARIIVSQLDSEPTMASLCASLTNAANEARLADGAAAARITTAVARQLPEGVIGVEGVLEMVVAPLAADRPVLLVVLDGFSMPIFTDLIGRLRNLGWNEYIDANGVTDHSVVAALPTVTEISRTSLLCGTLRTGDMGSEGRYFPAHAALVRSSRNGYPPQLFHKVQLRAGGLDTLPNDTIDAIHDERTHVVGVVLNNIDERLKDVAAPPAGWGLPELAPLGDLLDAARRSGRAVVVTSDHGHVLDRNADQRPGGQGGERWRATGSGPAGEGEITVSGPRVVTDDQTAVLPWLEQVRYGPRRNGYHGGLTLGEVAVPLAVLASDDIDGWTMTETKPPSWWHPSPVISAVEPAPPVAAPARPVTPPATPTLFDPVEPAVPQPTAPSPAARGGTPPSGPISQILATKHIQQQATTLRLDIAQVAAVLTRLDAASGTPVHEDRLADVGGIPRARIGRFVTQLQRLVNIDGYGVIETTNGEVRFDRSLLERQLGL